MAISEDQQFLAVALDTQLIIIYQMKSFDKLSEIGRISVHQENKTIITTLQFAPTYVKTNTTFFTLISANEMGELYASSITSTYFKTSLSATVKIQSLGMKIDNVQLMKYPYNVEGSEYLQTEKEKFNLVMATTTPKTCVLSVLDLSLGKCIDIVPALFLTGTGKLPASTAFFVTDKSFGFALQYAQHLTMFSINLQGQKSVWSVQQSSSVDISFEPAMIRFAPGSRMMCLCENKHTIINPCTGEVLEEDQYPSTLCVGNNFTNKLPECFEAVTTDCSFVVQIGLNVMMDGMLKRKAEFLRVHKDEAPKKKGRIEKEEPEPEKSKRKSKKIESESEEEERRPKKKTRKHRKYDSESESESEEAPKKKKRAKKVVESSSEESSSFEEVRRHKKHRRYVSDSEESSEPERRHSKRKTDERKNEEPRESKKEVSKNVVVEQTM